MAGVVESVDTFYAVDENAVELVRESMAQWVEEEVTIEPIIDTVIPGNNPFEVIANHWAGFIRLKTGARRRFRAWVPDADMTPIANVLLVHGFAEHSGRYHAVAKYLNDNGFNVFSYDHRFHGDDDDFVGWKITDIQNFDPMIFDCREIIGYVEEKSGKKNLPYFLYCHSMGGMIGLNATIEMQEYWNCKGIVFTCPLIKAKGNTLAPYPYSQFFRGVAHCVNSFAPGLQTPGIPAKDLSKVQAVIDALEADEKCFGEFVSTRWGTVMVTDCSYATLKKLHLMAAPFGLFLGEADKVTFTSGGKMFFERASSGDKEITTYPGLLHEIHNEPERDKVMSDIVNWLTRHL